MKKVRVVVYGTVGKAVTVNPDATDGAIVGENLRLPDGTVVTLDMLRGQAAQTGTAGATIWRLVREIPANIVEAENLSGAGLVTRQADGNWVVRSLGVNGGDFLTVTDADGDDGNPTIGADFAADITWGGEHKFDELPEVLVGMDYVPVLLDTLGIGDLADPGAERLLWWDPVSGAIEWLELGPGLAIDTGALNGTVDFDSILTDDDGAVLVDHDGNVLVAE
jgi:hypothetical protein